MTGEPRSRRWSALLSFVLLASLLPAAPVPAAPSETPPVTGPACPSDVPAAGFPDQGPPHGRAIDCLVWHGIARGLNDGTFGTNTDLVRRQLAVFLARTLSRVESFRFPAPAVGGFADVGGSGEVPGAIEALAAFQPPVIEGYPDGTFRGGNALTRAQAATFLRRAHDQVAGRLGLPPLPTGAVGGFADVHASDVHAPAIAALDAAGIIRGYPDGTFRPTDTVTRGQLASLLTRMLGLFAAAGVLLHPTDPVDPPDPTEPVDTDAVVRGSLEQVIVHGADPRTPITLLGPDGDEVASDALPWEVLGRQLSPGGDTTDANGSIVFRGSLDEDGLAYAGIPAGDGYRVRYVEDGESVTSAPFEVLEASGASTPDRSFYDDQELEEGFGYIETRDGTLLSATVILPGPPEDGPYPTVVEYSGYDLSDPPASALQSPGTALPIAGLLGYATVAVNIRGSGCSGGAFDHFETIQGLDGYDVIETVAAQDWSAKVGTAGVSYAGISQLFVAATQPPSLAAAAPVAIISDHFRDTVHPGGIYNTGFAREWAAEREEDTAWPGGQRWVEAAIAGEHPRVDADAAATCAENVLIRDQSLPLLDRIEGNDSATSLWVEREPFRFADDITTDLYLAVSSQDEQTGGRAGAILEGLDLDRDDRVVRYSGANGTHVEALSPELLGDLVEFLELYVAERTPVLTERPDIGLLRLALRTLYAGLLGTEGLPSAQQLPLRPDRFAGLDHADALAAYEAEPPAHILYENGAGLEGFPGFPASTFTHRFEWDELPNLDPDLDAEANTFHLRDGGGLTPEVPTEGDGDHSSYVYDPDSGAQPTYSFGWERPSNADVWLLQPAYEWHQPAAGEHLSFVTAPLEETAVTYGSASVDLWLDSDLDDTDLEVVLTEIRPDGNEMFVSSGWLRASRRQLEADTSVLRPRPSFRAEDAAPLADGWNEVRVEVFPFGHAFREGSRVRLTIEAPGGNRPLWRFDSTVGGGPTVENRIAHSPALPSKLVLPIVDVEVDVTEELPGCAPSETGAGFTAVRGQPCRVAAPG